MSWVYPELDRVWYLLATPNIPSIKVTTTSQFQKNQMMIGQVARLLQIPTVEKVCKKFVTHKINLENCIGEPYIGNTLKSKKLTKLTNPGRFCLADSFIGWTDTSKTLFTFIEVNIARYDNHKTFILFCPKKDVTLKNSPVVA